MKTRITLCAALLLALPACAPSAVSNDQDPSQAEGTPSAHGDFAGAREIAEPALHLATVNAAGVVSHFDLIDETRETLAEIDPVVELVGDGRFLFGVRDGSVSVIDSGVWSWSHGDHFHYYEAPSRLLGEIEGEGVATVIANDNGVGVRFADEAVLLDQKALSAGRLVERFRTTTAGLQGFIVALSDGAAIAESAPDAVPLLRIVNSEGTYHSTKECAEAQGSIATVVGVVIGCSDAALLSIGGSLDNWQRIPAPPGTAPATLFEAREGRPRIAGLASDGAVWILDTRSRAWTRYDTGEQIVRAAAIDDAEGQVVLLAATGEVLVLQEGVITARTAPLVAESLADPALAAGITFVVDQQRVYLNGPAEQSLWEIAPADDARISRTFETQNQPLLLAGTGR